MSDDRWVVLAEHLMNTAWVPLDTRSLELLALESELDAARIECAFDPFRPGEGGSYTRTVAQPIRLLVKEADLERAKEIAAALESEIGSPDE